MKISIVTACYNAAATIEDTIRSVLDQQGVDLEYIIVDGGSTDGTADIIRRSETRLAWWVSERDRGQVDALNKGFARATGDVLGFLNGDDMFTPGALKTMCDTFTENPGCELVQGQVEWMDLHGQPLGTHFGDINSYLEVIDIFRVWWGGRQWVQPEVFFREPLKFHVGEFDERYNLAFDFDFWVRCFRAGARVQRVPQTFARFRRHDGQKSVDTARANDEIRAIVAENLVLPSAFDPKILRRLGVELSYDLYQSAATRPPFLVALLRNPKWLLCAPVRQRLLASFR